MKTYADNTLMSMTKGELIEFIRTLEYNLKNANDTISIQYNNYKQLLKEERNKVIDDFAAELHCREFDNTYGTHIVIVPKEVDRIVKQLKG